MDMPQMPFTNLDEDAAIRIILEGTATKTGERFFEALEENLAKALHIHAPWIRKSPGALRGEK